MPTLIAFLSVVLILGGCAARISPLQRLGMDRFVGRPTAALVAVLGPGRSVRHRGDVTDLAFVSRQEVMVRAEPGFVYSGVNVRATAWIDRQECTTTFRVQNGKVSAWSVSGNHCSDMPLPRRNSTSALLAEDGLYASQPRPMLDSVMVEKGEFYRR